MLDQPLRVDQSANAGRIAGGVGGGDGFHARALFYVRAPNIGPVLQKAERLGGNRQAAERVPGWLVVGQLTAPQVDG
jgi:hypothetical protein